MLQKKCIVTKRKVETNEDYSKKYPESIHAKVALVALRQDKTLIVHSSYYQKSEQ